MILTHIHTGVGLRECHLRAGGGRESSPGVVPTGSLLGPVSEFLIVRVRMIHSPASEALVRMGLIHARRCPQWLLAILGSFLMLLSIVCHVLLLGAASRGPSVWPEAGTCRVH